MTGNGALKTAALEAKKLLQVSLYFEEQGRK